MKIKDEIKLAFNKEDIQDPELKKVFENHIAKMLWSIIKTGHITDQHFNGNCLNVASQINPKTNWEQFCVLTSHYLKGFGLVHLDRAGYSTVQDTEFWGGIYKLLKREGTCHVLIYKNGKKENL